MDRGDDPPVKDGAHADNATGTSVDSRRLELIDAVENGTPVTLGRQLPEWTPEGGGEPPADLVVFADTLREVLVDRELTTRADPRGLDIKGAIIVGHLDLADSTVPYRLGLRDCRFTDPLTVDRVTLHALNLSGSHFAGAIGLLNAHITGQLNLRGAHVTGTDTNGNVVNADWVRVDGAGAFLDQGFTAAGAVRLSHAHITGQLSLRGARITGDDTNGNSVHADGMRVDGGGAYLDQGFTAAGAVRLPGAHITGQLSLRGARITGDDTNGNSVHADGMRVDGDTYLDQGFTAQGAVRLLGAQVTGQLNLSGANIAGADDDGNCVNADDMRVDGGGAYLGQGFTGAGAVRLPGAHITGQLSLRGARITGDDTNGNSVHADGMRVDGDTYLDQGFTAQGAVRLPSSAVGDLYVGDTGQSLPKLGDATGWRIRDLQGVVRTDRKAAARWLDSQSAAQPWQELAAVYERNGQPADARWMRYKSAVRSTRSTRSRPSRLGRQIYRWTTGHGYYPLAAVVWLVVIFGLAWGLAAINADQFTTTSTPVISADLEERAEAATATGAEEDPPIPDPPPGRVLAAWCTDAWNVTCLDPAVYALTTAFPAAATTQPWAPPDGPLTVVFYVLRLAAWVFTALLLAGVTGLLRRQT
jgi:hypothetical protein